jgi:hypothetical protein
MKSLGTAACPPYHIAFVVGGLSADQALKVAKLASTKYYDNLPTSGNELGQAFRDTALEAAAQRQPRVRHRRPVWRQILRPRYSRHSPAAPRRFLPCRHGTLLLRRPQYQSQNQQTRYLAGEAGT